MPMIQAFISSQRAAATAAAFILTYFVALTLGRFFKRRAQVPLGLFFQTFCLTLAFYAAITVYGVQADWRKHVGAALALLSPAFIIALANHYLWDFYFEKKRQTPIPHILREIFALLVFLITLLLVLSFGYHAEAQLTGLLAGSGIVAIILGFAGQNLFGGIIAGVQLQISRPFRVGDWLQVGERFAEVMEINWSSTRLRSNDGIYLDIPNNEIVRQTIVNLHYPTQVHAMRIRVGIDYKTPPNRVKDALMRATRNAELVLRDQVLYGQSRRDQRGERRYSHQCLVRIETSANHHSFPDSDASPGTPTPGPGRRRSGAGAGDLTGRASFSMSR